MRDLSFVQALNEAFQIGMRSQPKSLFFGLGADDPRRLFGSSIGLAEEFGPQRVFDMPTSENAMMGVAVGAALEGYHTVLTSLRLDFFLLAMDQLVNSAAKWHYMYGGQDKVPVTVRLVMGRGWGQGPTHSQNLQAWFAHIPGLKVVMPSTPHDAKGLMLASFHDPNPVVFLEHRWVHEQRGPVPEGDYRVSIGEARKMHEGDQLTIVAMSYMSIEALRVVKFLAERGVHCDLIDLRSIQPLDWNCIRTSVAKTGRLLVLDTAQEHFGVAGEIVARASIELFEALKSAPRRLATPHFPVPTTFGLSDQFYPDGHSILAAVIEMLKLNLSWNDELPRKKEPHDVPGAWFKGPF